MAKSPRMDWPTPREGQDPWFEAFEGLVNAIDASSFAHRENDPVVLMEGGTVSFTAITGIVSWTGTIEVLAGITGFRWELPTDSISLQEGDILYVDLVRSPTKITTVTPQKSNQVPPNDSSLFLAIRRNNRIYWRDGYVLQDGQSINLFETGGGATGGAGAGLTPVAINEQTPDPTYLVVGSLTVNGTTFSSPEFIAVGNVSLTGLNGDVQLYNFTDASAVTTLNFTETTPTQKSASVALPAGDKLYEIRVRLNNGVASSDLLFTRWAGFDLTT